MAKWTKKDISICKNALSSFWLVNRPLGDSLREREVAYAAVRQHVTDHRVDVVCGGIAQLRQISNERALKNQQSADHFAEHPNVYGSATPEMIARFSKLAADDRKEATKAQMLIAKIQAEGLPPEVVAYDPISGDRDIRRY